MVDRRLRAVARERVAAGETTVVVARDLRVAQSTVYRWSRRDFPTDRPLDRCWVCSALVPTWPSTRSR